MNQRWVVVATLLALVVLCGVLYAPALRVGFLADDLFQISMLEGLFGHYSPAHLYAFAPEDPVSTAAHVQRGSLPWWTNPQFRFVMVRPLSSLLLAFDHWAWPRQPIAHHLHSAVWFLAGLGCAFALIRRTMGVGVAVAAVAFFAVDETMAWMVAWLANRCALVCTAFALLALLVRVRTSEQQDPDSGSRWRWRLGELLLWLGAFSGGEYAVGGVAYLGAYSLVGDPRPLRSRLVAMWPAFVALGGFASAYFLLRGGVYGGTTYVDPFGETGRFIEAASHRVPRMFGEVWINMAGESERFWLRYEDSGLSAAVMPPDIEDLDVQAWRHGAFSVLGSAALVVSIWWLARPYWSARERRTLRWMMLGSTLSLLPIAAIPPATRALLLPNLGAAVFVGAATVAAVRAWRAPPEHSNWRRALLAVVASGATYLHGVREFGYAREQIDALLGAQAAYARYYQSEALGQLDLRGKHVVVIATPGLVTGIHGISMMNVLGMPRPKTWHVLGMGPRPYTLRRVAARKLELGSVGGAMHLTPQEVLFRNPADAMRKGESVDAGLFTAKVLNDRGGIGPGSVLFRFRWRLEDPRLIFLEVGPDGLRPFSVPPVGKTVAIPPPALPNGAG